MATETRPEAKRVGDSLVCPACGGSEWRYVESIQSWRTVGEIVEDELCIGGFYQTGEGYDEGKDGYLECRGTDDKERCCLQECRIPDGMCITWT